AHGRPTLINLVESWNKMLQKEIEHTRTTKTDATSAFLASLEDPKLPSLGDTNKKPPIKILPPGMSSLSFSISAPKKSLPVTKVEFSQSGALPPVDSNQPEASPPTVDSTQSALDLKASEQQLLDSIGSSTLVDLLSPLFKYIEHIISKVGEIFPLLKLLHKTFCPNLIKNRLEDPLTIQLDHYIPEQELKNLELSYVNAHSLFNKVDGWDIVSNERHRD
uniref:Uncharacterized protein n=1 Tax=Chenopodium quinoa TaxID=63459 RepID=A0A803LZV3_CHEQI